MTRRHVGALAVTLALVTMSSSCGNDPDATSVTAATTTSSGPDFSKCTPPTLHGGTWVDTEGKVHDPRTAPTPPPLPTTESTATRSGDTTLPYSEPTLPAQVRDAALKAARSDKIVGALLSNANASLVDTTAWLGQHEQPIGVVLWYRFEEAVDLPQAHGQIIQAADVESGNPGKYDENGLPTKAQIGAREVWPQTEMAMVFIASKNDEVYALQPMTDNVRHPC